MSADARLREQSIERRLSEAEATITALLAGQVDAVVDAASGTPLLLHNAQKALADNERLYRSTFDGAPVGIVHVGLDGEWLHVNPRICTLLGYRCEDLETPAVQRVVEGEQVAGEAQAFQKMAAGTQSHHLVDEKRYWRADGSVMWARVNMSTHHDAQGRPEHVMLVIEDITERRLLEARAQGYLDKAAVILLALDREGRITLVNRYACDMLGWTADELLGRSWIDTCLPARIRPDQARRFLGLIAGDTSVGENPVLTRSGEERLIEWRNTLSRDDAGRVIGTFSSGTDITERSHAVAALRTAEERMRFALESADVGIWDMDCATGALRWSETNEAHYGLEPGAFGGTFEAFEKLIHPDDRAAVLETVGKAMLSGSDFSVRNRSIWPDGTVRWLNGVGRIFLDERGKALRGVGISLDVTEHRKLEDQYQHAQKMEAVGRLAGGVAHDFNNLLTVISGFTDILLEGLPPEDPRRQDLDEIRKAAQAAASLTRQLLTFSRQQVIEPKNIAIGDAVAAAAKMLERIIGEDVDVVAVRKETSAIVRMDPGQLEQVIVNLAINARDAMPAGGQITIETSIEELTEHDAATHWPVTAGRYAMLAMSDNGIGMNEQTQSRMFEPFFTTKDAGKGTGLGLATVYGIVRQSDGFIWVYSEPGQGATFKIYLPLVEGAPVSGQLRNAKEGAPRGVETVLLVEDSDSVRGVARRVLERQGYKVIEASSASVALDQARNFDGEIHLLLTDVVMPEMSGRVLAEALAQLRPLTKLLYMSGYTDDAVVRHGVLRAETPYLQKPFSPRTLAARVREVLDGAQRLEDAAAP